jgi:hypothetical protein
VNTTFTPLSFVVLSLVTVPTKFRSPNESVNLFVTVVVKLSFGGIVVGVGTTLTTVVWS